MKLPPINNQISMFSRLAILFLTLSAGLLLSSMIPRDTELNDLEKYRLKGKVKSIMEIKTTIAGKSDKLAGNGIVYQKFMRFDENGYLQEMILYKNGAEYLASRYSPGNDGKITGMNEYHPDGSLNLNVKYHYDDSGILSEALFSWSENRVVGEICEWTDYYGDIIQNTIFSKVIYVHEYRGYCVQEDFLKPDGSLSFRLTSKYDFRGNKTESAYFRGNEMLAWVTKYTYDRYDNLLESRVLKDNRIAVKSEYKHQFDETGNWTSRKEKREVHVNILTAGINQSDMVTERKIEYY